MDKKSLGWYETKKELMELFDEKDYDEIIRYVQDNSDILLSLIKKEVIKDSNGLLRYEKAIIDELADEKICNNKEFESLYSLGFLSGIIKSCMCVAAEKRQLELLSVENEELYCRITYLDRVVEIVGKQKSISHTELAEELSIYSSTLSEAMKKILKTGLISYKRFGKYKLYSLTDKGVRYIRLLRKKNPVVLDQFANLFDEMIVFKERDARKIFQERVVESEQRINWSGKTGSCLMSQKKSLDADLKYWESPNGFRPKYRFTTKEEWNNGAVEGNNKQYGAELVGDIYDHWKTLQTV